MNGELKSTNFKAQSPVKQSEREKPNAAGKQRKPELPAPLMSPASHARTAQDIFVPGLV